MLDDAITKISDTDMAAAPRPAIISEPRDGWHTQYHLAGCNKRRPGNHFDFVARRSGHARITNSKSYSSAAPLKKRTPTQRAVFLLQLSVAFLSLRWGIIGWGGRMLRCVPILALGCVLAACVQPSLHLINSNSISAVVNDVKYQTSVYLAQAKYLQQHPDKDDETIRQAKGHFRCGNGDINVVLTGVKIELATTLDATSGATFSTSIPLTVLPITIGPSASGSVASTNSQELVFNEYPVPNSQVPPHYFASLPPIASTLFALRKALILGATNKGVCFQSIPKKGDADANTFKIALTVVEDTTGGVTVGVGALSFGVTQEVKSTTGNTVTVTFELQNKMGKPVRQMIKQFSQ
jgi:hypothetical protein